MEKSKNDTTFVYPVDLIVQTKQVHLTASNEFRFKTKFFCLPVRSLAHP